MGLKTRKSGAMINLKIKNQAFPEFQLMGKEDGDWVVKQTETSYEGIFSDAKIEEYEYQKKMRKKLVMEFNDYETGEKETVSVNFNSLALSIINTLSNIDNLVGCKLSFNVYSKKDEKGEDRPRIFIEANGEKAGWKFGTEVISKIYEHHDKWVDMFNKNVEPKLGLTTSTDDEGSFPDDDDDMDMPESKSTPENFDDDLPF